MDTTILTDILLIVLSTFLVFIMVCVSFFVLWIILILRKIYSLINMIKKESEKITTKINEAGESVKNKGEMAAFFVINTLSFFRSIGKKSNKN
jgi:F0F1-type ATP synthase membrane subunit b/b'